MSKMNLTLAASIVCIVAGASAHGASFCSDVAEIDQKTRYTSMYDAQTQQKLADLRQATINDLISHYEPIVKELIVSNPKFADHFSGSLGDLHRKQLIESIFSKCAVHIDYEEKDAVLAVVKDLANQLGVQ